MDFVIDVAFVIAAVAFFKAQFGLKGWGAIGVAFLLSLGLSFLPELYSAFPQFQPYLEKVVGLVQLFLTAPGLFDLTKELQKSKALDSVG